jgi:hypothetical protein
MNRYRHGRRPELADLRRLAVVVLLAALLALVGFGGLATMPSLESLAATAHGTPAPGQPGGNHSDPGDNKNKKKPAPNRSNNDSRPNQGSDSNLDSQRRQPQSRIDATQIDQTDRNNRLAPDGDNRSVGIQTGNDGAARQAAPDRQPANANPSDEAAEARDGIPPNRELTPAEQATYNYFRGPNAVRRLPSSTAAKALYERYDNGEEPYSDRPFGPDFNAGQRTVDHLIPVQRAVQIPGLSDLDRQTQESIIDGQDNLVLTPLRENVSRRNLTYAEWPGRSAGPELDPAYRAARIAQENEVYRQLQQQVDTAWSEQFPGRPLPSAGPLEIDRTTPPLDIDITVPPESPPLQAGPELPVGSPVELPAEPPPVELPANPVPVVPNYPLPPAAQPVPPAVGNPAPIPVGSPPPAVLPDAEPVPIGLPEAPPIVTPAPPPIVTPNPVSPWDVLFPGAVPSPVTAPPVTSDIMANLPAAASAPSAPMAVEPSIRIPVSEVIDRLPAELLQAPGLLIPLPAPVVGPCAWGGCPPKPMALPVFISVAIGWPR